MGALLPTATCLHSRHILPLCRALPRHALICISIRPALPLIQLYRHHHGCSCLLDRRAIRCCRRCPHPLPQPRHAASASMPPPRPRALRAPLAACGQCAQCRCNCGSGSARRRPRAVVPLSLRPGESAATWTAASLRPAGGCASAASWTGGAPAPAPPLRCMPNPPTAVPGGLRQHPTRRRGRPAGRCRNLNHWRRTQRAPRADILRVATARDGSRARADWAEGERGKAKRGGRSGGGKGRPEWAVGTPRATTRKGPKPRLRTAGVAIGVVPRLEGGRPTAREFHGPKGVMPRLEGGRAAESRAVEPTACYNASAVQRPTFGAYLGEPRDIKTSLACRAAGHTTRRIPMRPRMRGIQVAVRLGPRLPGLV
jgi:hypothetical protein